MEQIGSLYGKFILEGIVVVCLAGFLFCNISDTDGNAGMLEMIGSNLPKIDEKYDSYTDFKEVYKEESNKDAPKIFLIAGAVDIGKIKLSQIIKAVDYSGSEIKLEVMSIKNMQNEELIENYNLETMEIDLTNAGVYSVLVKATDDGNRTTECQIKIPVNNKQLLEDVD
ncbi:MAG: hypothetical protein IKW08_08400 [Roseburia sp.]|nr:hypothetical protein [Roseburia sp.]